MGTVVYGVFSLTGRKESQGGGDPVGLYCPHVSHYAQILFNLGVAMAALWYIPYSI